MRETRERFNIINQEETSMTCLIEILIESIIDTARAFGKRVAKVEEEIYPSVPSAECIAHLHDAVKSLKAAKDALETALEQQSNPPPEDAY